MQFSVSKSALVQALALASRAIEKRTTIPILGNLKLEAGSAFLTVTGTDLETALSVRVPADVREEGATTIPGAKLYGYVKLLPEGAVKFKLDTNQWTTVTSGKSRMKIGGTAADTFPERPPEPEVAFTVPASEFLALVNRTKLAISAEASRFTLNGALMECKGGRLVMVATDGHRLAYASRELEGVEFSVLIPRNAMGHIATLTEGVEQLAISQDENHLFFRAGQAVLISRKLAGNFPDYKRVLPADLPNVVTLKRAELSSAISRVAQFADERSHAIRLTLKAGGLEVFSSSVETGESSESVECEYSGDEVEVGYNASYLQEFLTVLSMESVTFHLKDAKSAGELRAQGSDDYRYIVMPMRI